MSDALPVPEASRQAKDAFEVARIWIVDGDQHVVLSPRQWKDPAAWGLMLVDLARHVARAYSRKGADEQEVLSRIREGFQAEWDHPTE